MKKKLKDFVSFLRLRRPIDISMGKGSWIMRPFLIINRDAISIGSRTTIRRSARIQPLKEYGGQKHKPSIEIGDDVYIGSDVFIAAIGQLTIEERCVFSDHVYLNDSSHGFDLSKGLIIEQPLESKGPIHIGPECFLGYRVCIMPGVTLGRNCIVGANSVVTRSFPPFSTIGGVPARLIHSRTIASDGVAI